MCAILSHELKSCSVPPRMGRITLCSVTTLDTLLAHVHWVIALSAIRWTDGRSIAVPVLKRPFFYFIKAARCKSSDASDSDRLKRSCQVLALPCHKVISGLMLWRHADVTYITSSHCVGIISSHIITRTRVSTLPWDILREREKDHTHMTFTAVYCYNFPYCYYLFLLISYCA